MSHSTDVPAPLMLPRHKQTIKQRHTHTHTHTHTYTDAHMRPDNTTGKNFAVKTGLVSGF